MYALIPSGVLLLGGFIASQRKPRKQLTSYLQHFAGGLVLAALSTELLPEIMHRHAPIGAAIGFAVGTALMLTIRATFGGEHGDDGDEGRGPAWSSRSRSIC